MLESELTDGTSAPASQGPSLVPEIFFRGLSGKGGIAK